LTDTTGDERFSAPLSKPNTADLSGFALQLQQGNAAPADANATSKNNDKGKPAGTTPDATNESGAANGDQALLISLVSLSADSKLPLRTQMGNEQSFLPDMKLFGGADAQTNQSSGPDLKNQINSASQSTVVDASGTSEGVNNATALAVNDQSLLSSLQPQIIGQPHAVVQTALTGTQTPAGSDITLKSKDLSSGSATIYSTDNVIQTLASAGFAPAANSTPADFVQATPEPVSITQIPVKLASAPTNDASNGQHLIAAKGTIDSASSASMPSFDTQLLASLQSNPSVATSTDAIIAPVPAASPIIPVQIANVNDVPKTKELVAVSANYTSDSVTQTLTAAGFIPMPASSNINNFQTVADANPVVAASTETVKVPHLPANASIGDTVSGQQVAQVNKIVTQGGTDSTTGLSTYDSQLLASLQPHGSATQSAETPVVPTTTTGAFVPLQLASASEYPSAQKTQFSSYDNQLLASLQQPMEATTTTVGDKGNHAKSLSLPAELSTNLVEQQQQSVQSVQQQIANFEYTTKVKDTTPGVTSYGSDSSSTTLASAGFGQGLTVPNPSYYTAPAETNYSFAAAIDQKTTTYSSSLVSAAPTSTDTNHGTVQNVGSFSEPAETKYSFTAPVDQKMQTASIASETKQSGSNLVSTDVQNYGVVSNTQTGSGSNGDVIAKGDQSTIQAAKVNAASSDVPSFLANLDASATPSAKTDLSSTKSAAITQADTNALNPAGTTPANQVSQAATQIADNTGVKSGIVDKSTTASAVAVADATSTLNAKSSSTSTSTSTSTAVPLDKVGQPEFRLVGPGTPAVAEQTSSQAVLAAVSLKGMFARQSTTLDNSSDLAIAGLQSLLTQGKATQAVTAENAISAATASGIQKSLTTLAPTIAVPGTLVPTDGKSLGATISVAITLPAALNPIQSESHINNAMDVNAKAKLIALNPSLLQGEENSANRVTVGVVSAVTSGLTLTGNISNDTATIKGIGSLPQAPGITESGEKLGSPSILINRAPLVTPDGKIATPTGRLPINDRLPPELTEIASTAKPLVTIGGALPPRTEFIEDGTTKKQGDAVIANAPLINNILVGPTKIGGKGSGTADEIEQPTPPRAGITGGGTQGTAAGGTQGGAAAGGAQGAAQDPHSATKTVNGTTTAANQNDPSVVHGATNATTTTQELVDQLPHLIIVDKNSATAGNAVSGGIANGAQKNNNNDETAAHHEPARIDAQNSDTSALIGPRHDIESLGVNESNANTNANANTNTNTSTNTNDTQNSLTDASMRNDQNEGGTEKHGARTECDSLYPENELTDETIRISGIKNKNNVDNLSNEDELKDFVRNFEERRLYQIRKGDTLSSIAEKKLGSNKYLPLLIELNRDIIIFKADGTITLQPGCYINLPSQADIARFVSMGEDARAAYSNPEDYQSPDFQATYACRYGDNLKTVAKRHPALRDARLWTLLAEVNKLSTRQTDKKVSVEKLKRGQVLIIPSARQKQDFLQQLPSNPTPKPLTGSIFSNENKVRVVAGSFNSEWPAEDDSNTTVTGGNTNSAKGDTRITKGDSSVTNGDTIVTGSSPKVTDNGTTIITDASAHVTTNDVAVIEDRTIITEDCTRITNATAGALKPVRGKAWIQERNSRS
jgi:trimeric autotransporter adhesin